MDFNKDNKKKWMEYAFREAEKAFQQEEVPIGAIIVKDNQIIGRGYNQCETLNDGTAHAEMIAITSAASSIKNWRLDGCSLYVTKEPCLMCAGAIVNSRLSNVIFGAYDNKYGCASSLYQLCSSPKFPHKATVFGGILEGKCLSIIRDFFELKRAKIKGYN